MPIPLVRGVLATGALIALSARQPRPEAREVVVNEGTSMAVAASPDGRQLALDLQGSIWLIPAAGGPARRITDEYNDARQPAWSPDGRTIAFQGFRDGGYDIWAVNTDGTRLRRLTSGPYDDREPAWSADGKWLAFSSDRSGNYDVWLLELATGALHQLTRDPGDDYMPTFSPASDAVAFVGTRGGAAGIHEVAIANGRERPVTSAPGRYDAPSWGPSGRIVYHNAAGGTSRLEVDGTPLTGSQNAFAFKAAWIGDDIVYVADGRLWRRALTGATPQPIPFSATLRVTRPAYTRRARDVTSRTARQALGVVGPVLSPDASQVAFVALGDLHVMPVGQAPANLTRDAALDADPTWSPDGRYIAWASDRADDGTLLDLWIHDTETGENRRLTTEPTSAMAPAWSPDGREIAYLDVDGIWRAASVWVVEVATGRTRKIHDQMFGPGAPTWSPDGQRVLLTALQRYSARFREGTNQLLSIAAAGGDDRWYTPVPHLSIDSRVGAGPTWSPDGAHLALVYEGHLTLVPVTPRGEPLGPPRRLTSEIAHAPSWSADGRRLLYQSNDKLRLLDLDAGTTRDVPLALAYRPAIPAGRVVVHAGRLVDGQSATPRTNVDIIIAGNRIERIVPHAAANARGARTVDASQLTVMPGLIEYHTHLQKDLGQGSGKAYLAFGVTTVRSPGSTPYEAVEDREAVDAGTRPGPRYVVTGYLMEWQRVYYKMAVAISSTAHLELELQRARALQHDLLKSYVRMPDLQQRRIAEFAHAMGVPAASHEVYPAALSGMDGTEHTTGTSRRGYSPKAATLQRSYADVGQLFAASGMPLTPTLALGGGGFRRLVEQAPALARDPRFALYPPWLRATVTGNASLGAPAGAVDPGAGGQMVMGLQKAGTRIVAGTDTPNAATLHGELYAYVLAGMTPAEALRTATVNSAQVLGLDAGVVAPGKLADLAIVDGNPLEDITTTANVRYTIANGRVYDVRELVGPRAR